MEFASPAWCERYPTSALISDLIEPFRGNVEAFLAALAVGGATVHIAATFRPPERAYLMHWCCQIAGYRRQGVFTQAAPGDAELYPGVAIDWTCGGDIGAARAAAVAMREGYGIVYPAALVSRHTQRRAIDMTIHVPAGSTIADAHGNRSTNLQAADGMTASIIAIGKSFGVIKLLSDPPHWSDDGH